MSDELRSHGSQLVEQLDGVALCGAGPTNLDRRVVNAMRRPLRGFFDPEFLDILDDIRTYIHRVFKVSSSYHCFALSSTGTAAMEAGMSALLGNGEKCVVCCAGYFGQRLKELARLRGAELIELDAPPGSSVDPAAVESALRSNPDVRLVAVVDAETSTGVRQPLDQIGAAVNESDALLLVDCVTSLGGTPVEPERFGGDYCYSCSQKCLGAPPGLAPVVISERAWERLTRRGASSLTFDFERLEHYWRARPPRYHHTPPILALYALHEALRLLLDEGLEVRWARHDRAGRHLQNGLEEYGFSVLADTPVRLPQLTAVIVPEGMDGRRIQERLRLEHGIEVGGTLDSTGPQVWRIGLMGVNATVEMAQRLLDALADVCELA